MSAFEKGAERFDTSRVCSDRQHAHVVRSRSDHDAQPSSDIADRIRQLVADHDELSTHAAGNAGECSTSATTRGDLDQDVLESVLQHPAARVLLERVVDWKAAEGKILQTADQQNAVDEEYGDATSDADALLAEILSHPKIPLFPDSFPAQLENAYMKARYCGSTNSRAIIQDAAEKEYHLAEAYLSILYEMGCKVLVQDTGNARLFAGRALPWLRTHAAKGNNYAQFHLGFCYHDGRGVEQNEVESARWFKLAAEQGHVIAQYNLGYCYEIGTGVAKDPVEAVRLYRLAAKQGHATAQCNLGYCYDNGTGVTKDPVEAVRLYRLAAEQGDANAQCCLGICYKQGTGVTKDPVEAVRLYAQAAEQGFATGQHYLALNLWDGVGVAQNLAEAKRYFQLAADKGHAKAADALANYRVSWWA